MLIILLSVVNFPQEEIKEETVIPDWVPSGMVAINLNQINFSNWTKGGENSLAVSGLFNGGAAYKADGWTWNNELKVAYGRTKTGTSTYRTTDNELFFESIVSRHIGFEVDPYLSVSMRTVVAKGFDYKNVLEPQISAFFDPGYLSESLGFTYDKLYGFKTRLGIAFHQIFTNKFRQYSDNPDTPEMESFLFETGVESVTEGKLTIDENILLTSQLRLFSAFDRLDVWDVIFDNAITAKVNNYLNVNFTFILVHIVKETVKTQTKQGLQIGFTYSLF